MNDTIPNKAIIGKINHLRGVKVMLDRDLAELYGVETGQLKRQVRRNVTRFPDDFMFELTEEEYIRCQFGTLNRGEQTKYFPMAFTEQGIAMLSSVLNSERAIQVNIQIMRVFTALRCIMSTLEDLKRKIEKLEKKYDDQIQNRFHGSQATAR